MRIYNNARELMSEMGRDLWEMGLINSPKTYQNKVIEGDEKMVTKELICKQYCLTELPDPEMLFVYTHTHEWADAEFNERVNEPGVNPGEAWKLNPQMWREFLVQRDGDMVFDYTYSERINRGVNWFRYHEKEPWKVTNLLAIIELLKQDPDTRKAVLSIYDASEDANHYMGDARIPCSMYYDFLIRDTGQGKQLNIVYHQRSADFVGHFGDDVYLAWRLMEYVAKQVGVKPGYLFHTIDSLHSYKRDWHFLKTSVDEL